jgi:hypothetical protein
LNNPIFCHESPSSTVSTPRDHTFPYDLPCDHHRQTHIFKYRALIYCVILAFLFLQIVEFVKKKKKMMKMEISCGTSPRNRFDHLKIPTSLIIRET